MNSSSSDTSEKNSTPKQNDYKNCEAIQRLKDKFLNDPEGSWCVFPTCAGGRYCYHMSWSPESLRRAIARKQADSVRFLEQLYKDEPDMFGKCSTCGKYQLHGNHCTHCYPDRW